MYEGANHGFHNDTTPRYDEAAAKLAWKRTVAFFKKHLVARKTASPNTSRISNKTGQARSPRLVPSVNSECEVPVQP